MKKTIVWIVIILVIFAIFFVAFNKNESVPNPVQQIQKQQTVPNYPCTNGKCA